MLDKIIETEKTKLKILGYYQIFGGALGILIVAYSMLTLVDISISSLLIVGTFVCLYLFSMFCGQQLVFGNVNLGLKLSTINQLLQVIHVSLFGLTYKYVSGLMVTIGFDYTTDFNLLFNFVLSTFELTISLDSDKIIIGINLTAVYIIYLIDQLKHKIKTTHEI